MKKLETQINKIEKILTEKHIHGKYLDNFEEVVLENQLEIMKTLNQLNINLRDKGTI